MLSSTTRKLYLHPDNPCNTTITEDDSPVYHIITTLKPQKVTTFKDDEGRILASSEWKDVRSDIITLGSAKPVSSSVWLNKSAMPFKQCVLLVLCVIGC